MAFTRPSVREQRLLVGKFDVRSIPFDRPSPRCGIPRDLRKSLIRVGLIRGDQDVIGAGPEIGIPEFVVDITLSHALEVRADRIGLGGISIRRCRIQTPPAAIQTATRIAAKQ